MLIFSSANIRAFRSNRRLRRVAACAMNGWMMMMQSWMFGIAMFLIVGIAVPPSHAQPPGTLPPDQIFQRTDESLPIRAFMFLTEAENNVLMPGVTWEEYERRMNLDSDSEGLQQPFSYQSLAITGVTEDSRAELEVTMKLSIESTKDRWIKIPLGMANFHRLAPPDVSGIDEYSMSFESESLGYVLHVKTAAVEDAMVRIQMSSSVQMHSLKSVEFRLPDVPSQVQLTIDDGNVDGDVLGRGDETLRSSPKTGNKTEFAIESGGGNFAVRWGEIRRSADDAPLLEVDSRIDVRWDSPQDQPIMSVRLTIRNAKGSIEGFQLRLPKNSVVLDTPRLGTSGQTIEFLEQDDLSRNSVGGNRKGETDRNNRDDDLAGELRTVVIPEEEHQQRIELNFDLQLAADATSPSSPLGFRAVEVVGSLRHRGELTIQTSGDYRLRWRTRAWVRSESSESAEEGLSSRLYRFRFDRASFELPIWLSAKERQTRVTSASELTIHEGVASIVMDVQVSGQATDGRLQIDDASWNISSIENVETGEPLESFRSDALRTIDFSLDAGEGSSSIRIRAQRLIDDETGNIEFAIPRVVADDESLSIQNATLNLISSGRTMLVVDLERSEGLTRIGSSSNETTNTSTISTFRMLSPDGAATLVGNLVDQPPRITLSSDATIELDGDQLRSTVDWMVTSPLDLEGRLPIRIAKPAAVPTTRPGEIASAALTDVANAIGSPSTGFSAGELGRFDGLLASQNEPWVVTVDGVPATLRALDDDRYELISERLSLGTMAIRWRLSQSRRSSSVQRSIETVSLPRPNIADVTVRGNVRVNLRGNQQFDLTSTDSVPASTLDFDSLPRDPLRLRLQTRVTATDEISIHQALLRTIVGRSTRQEQVIARLQGGDSFQVELPAGTPDVSVEAMLDDVRVPVQRQGNALIIPLAGHQQAGDQQVHVVDLRVWIALPTSSSFASIRPMIKLPIGVGRVYWQIIAPTDGHVVWASPTVGRSMTWQFDRWRLSREPSHSNAALAAIIGASADSFDETPPGNSYLYVGSDLPSFEVVIASRTILWICVGSFVLLLAVLLTHIPKTRHPLTAVVVAVLFAGLLAVAPDAAVLAGQLGMISLVLVIVMITIRSLITPSGGNRVFTSPSSAPLVTPASPAPPSHPSTRTVKPISPETPSIASTQALPKPTEASP
ncbi:hypothetical protein [Rubripirellula reticaptiva]|uniref:Uncharacterized protein n=1 Tax=Rubripirellula reticaptiva TaxID=2528013 RepID=A0A5C6F1L0_9BACT|nr:hypothetical protein [Rubripirellula reticaptiva]TWU55238.1 hypothetical protein Poly59_15350 [Rubripirellula reticaptiva]